MAWPGRSLPRAAPSRHGGPGVAHSGTRYRTPRAGKRRPVPRGAPFALPRPMREALEGVGSARTGMVSWGAALCSAMLGCHRREATQLVVGIQSDPMGGVVTALHVVIRVAGAVVDDERIQPPRGSRVGFPQPW